MIKNSQIARAGPTMSALSICLYGRRIDASTSMPLARASISARSRLLTISAARPGDTLVLTKEIGTGVIATAHKRGAAPDGVLAAAVASMTTLNAAAGEAALAAGVVAATDVTGFSLLGHLHRMLRASGVSAVVGASTVPLLPGAAELTEAGHVSGGTRNNISYLAPWTSIDAGVAEPVAVLLQDAQTSGGLLLSTPSPEALRRELEHRGVLAAVIGYVTAGSPGHIEVRQGM